MTKKSLMIASAIILPLTVGVTAMGICAGNNHNIANNLFATDTIASSITFANPSSSPEKVANKVYSTRSATSTNAPIYLINNADDTNNPGVGYVGIFKEQVKTDKLSFYWDYSNSEQVKFQKVTNISMTIEANTNRYFVIETSDDGVSFSKLTDFTIGGGSGSVDVNVLDKYIRIMYDSSRTLLYDTKVQSITLSYKCSPSGNASDTTSNTSDSTSTIKNTYVVSWKNYDGTILLAETYEYGETPSYKGDTPIKPKDPQYTYSFSGWSPTISDVVCDTSYTAQFSKTINSYEVKWANYNGDILLTETYEYGETPTYTGSTPIRPTDDTYYYDFLKWSPDITAVSCDITYTAVFESTSLLSFRRKAYSYSVTGCVMADAESLIVPSTYKGLPVDEIEQNAFKDCKKLETIVIPDSVVTIGVAAFQGCDSLKSMTLPFVGQNKNATSPDTSTVLGSIFSEYSYSSKEGSIMQYYNNNSDAYYNIPTSLESIIVTGGNIFYGAFSNCSFLKKVELKENVTSLGDNAFSRCSSLTSITIPTSVTSIGEFTFYFCSSLTSITIPDSVTSIGEGAFWSCSSLTSITIPDGVTSIGGRAFAYCSALTSVTIQDGVTSIGGFYCCTSLTSITIPDSVTSIGSFNGCTSLTSITIPDSVTSIGSFSNCTSLTSITIPDSVTSIGSFSNCTSLTSITIPDSVTSIGERAFENCSSLTSITIPNNITAIKEKTFLDCSALTSITIPDGVKSIGRYAFDGCVSLSSITIPNTVTSIENGAFSRCSSLTSITIPNNITTIGANTFKDCSSLTSITIPDSVTSLGYAAFSGCSSLTSITIPDSVTSLGDNAFSSCSSLTSIIIPNSVTSLGHRAFSNCSSLTSITIPDRVASLGNSAFYNCSSLTSIIIPNSVTSLGKDAFYNCTSINNVFYCGTRSEWSAITDNRSRIPSDKVFYYSETVPLGSGNYWRYVDGVPQIW